MLHELPPPHREDCVNSLAYEADARVQDPVYGCVGSIPVLQQQVLPQTHLFSVSLHFFPHSNSQHPAHVELSTRRQNHTFKRIRHKVVARFSGV
ncbi:hypothetical protein M758_4G255900 [Ceratodon purpureus]|uniref:LOB domain-containing protein n=1 Tax=Ceratodon purpureus TaxID=3225 RepID=A0A8T0IF88_CERPU|nr:hypothetical protein KC19_4G261500 [Ceratodon purpureus]KAG0620932.1 hypothetical protein M758_4G255900 [Ceratodon purpureus]